MNLLRDYLEEPENTRVDLNKLYLYRILVYNRISFSTITASLKKFELFKQSLDFEDYWINPFTETLVEFCDNKNLFEYYDLCLK